jgi:hypothetical protein
VLSVSHGFNRCVALVLVLYVPTLQAAKLELLRRTDNLLLLLSLDGCARWFRSVRGIQQSPDLLFQWVPPKAGSIEVRSEPFELESQVRGRERARARGPPPKQSSNGVSGDSGSDPSRFSCHVYIAGSVARPEGFVLRTSAQFRVDKRLCQSQQPFREKPPDDLEARSDSDFEGDVALRTLA